MEDEVIEETGKAKDMVEKILAKDERARCDDLWLVISIWRKQGFKIFIRYEDMPDMLAMETITRCRRKIQNTDGKYLPSNEQVAIRRRIKEEIFRNYFGHGYSEKAKKGRLAEFL